MKKFIFTLIALVSVLATMAQDSLYIYKHNGDIISYLISDIDSISFYRPAKENNHVVSITINREAIGIIQGNSYMLTAATITDDESEAEVSWKSSNPSIASVNQYGLITGVNAGCVEIIAQSGSMSDTCFISVVSSPTAVYHHGYQGLNDNDKALYRYMLMKVMQFEANATTYSDYIYNRVYLDFTEVGVTPSSSTDITRITNLITKDYHETFHIGSYIFRYDYTLNQYYIRTIITITPKKYYNYMKDVYTAVGSILAEAKVATNQFDKTKLSHDEFIDWNNYGGMSSANNGNYLELL